MTAFWKTAIQGNNTYVFLSKESNKTNSADHFDWSTELGVKPRKEKEFLMDEIRSRKRIATSILICRRINALTLRFARLTIKFLNHLREKFRKARDTKNAR